MILRGTKLKEFCKRGHERAPHNINAQGNCRECLREMDRKRYVCKLGPIRPNGMLNPWREAMSDGYVVMMFDPRLA